MIYNNFIKVKDDKKIKTQFTVHIGTDEIGAVWFAKEFMSGQKVLYCRLRAEVLKKIIEAKERYNEKEVDENSFVYLSVLETGEDGTNNRPVMKLMKTKLIKED